MQGTKKYTVTWYCSKQGGKRGSVDNPLKKGEVAIMGMGPTNRKIVNAKDHILQAEFNYIKFNGNTYKVADECDIQNNVDIYQGDSQPCIKAEHCI